MKMKKSLSSLFIIIAFLGSVMGFLSQRMKREFKKEVETALGFYSQSNPEILTEKEIEILPDPVKNYLKYVGVVGKPKVWNFRIEMEGKMRNDAESRWMTINSVQYNFVENPVRMFYIKGSMFGMPAYGLHSYKNEEGSMLIKALGLFAVVDQRGKEMNISDTVTILNDMCVFAPATLIDKRITWNSVDELTVNAALTIGKNKVSANLYFNEKGELVNFISEDRYRGYERARWSTPISKYNQFDEVNLSATASAMWHFPDREFSYAEFEVKKVEYNVQELR